MGINDFKALENPRRFAFSSMILTLGALEVHRNDRWQVSLDVLEWEKVSGESSTRDVVDWADVFVIGWILTGARNPNNVGLWDF